MNTQQVNTHAVRLYGEGGLGITIELIHIGACDQKDQNGECILQDWVENVGDDLVHGEVTVPVRVEWLNDDSPVLHLQPNECEAAGAQKVWERALSDAVKERVAKSLDVYGPDEHRMRCKLVTEILEAALTEETPDAG